ncbi:MAG: ABC transporter permease [Campylobacterota bacterium]|nr:ABC transporter permease [Campylobacterota bacterium]
MNYIQEFIKFIKHILENNKLLIVLIKNDFKKQYLGSYLGLLWAFIQPLVFIAVIWFVFEIGFRRNLSPDDTPFFLWLICGMIPWFFFVNGLTSGTNAIISNAFLVKKVAFRVSILPLVQIGSAFIIHIVLVVVLVIAFILYGYFPSIYWIQLFYYMLCSMLLLLGLLWLTSALRVFIKDIGNFIAVIVQVGFWATPIFWSFEKVPEQYQYLVKLNPMFYIVEGFRDTFINHVWFWEKSFDTFYFIGIATTLCIVGAIVFRKLRPHFGDVL